jgi:2'-5' RNA ligase
LAGGFPSSFLAIPVEDGPWRTARIRTLPPRVRALHPADVHVTLAFLGGVPPARAQAAFDAVSSVDVQAMQASIGRVVPLGPEGRWTALSALLEDAPKLADAMLRVRAAASAAAGVPEQTHAPLPHITLARLHARASDIERQGALRWAMDCGPGGSLVLARLALYTGRREKVPGEPAYDIVAVRELAPAAW